MIRTTFSGIALAGMLAAMGCHASEPPLPIDVGESSSRGPRSAEAPPQTPAQPHSIDLATALRIAAGSHLDILEARARVREAEGYVQVADGFLLPILTVGGSWGRTQGTVQASFGNLGETRYGSINTLGTVQLSANVGQAIYHDIAVHRIATATAEFELGQVQRTLLDVSEEYIALVEGDATVRINEQLVQEAQGLVRYTQARETQGLGPALDTERARTLAADAEQKLIAARNERQRRSKKLAASLRLDSSVDLAPVDRDLAPATLVNPAETMQQWLARAAERRPETRAYRATVQAAKDEASATRWLVWGPTVSAGYLFGGVGRSSIDSVDERESWVASVGWTFSLGGPGRIEAAEARAQQAAIQLQRFQDHLEASVAGAYQELVLSRARLDPAQRGQDSAEKALRLARVNFEGGVLPENDLLIAQQAADQARQQRLTAVTRFDLAQLELLAEAGVASVDSLSPGAGK
jgi:outer membrane protein TolC